VRVGLVIYGSLAQVSGGYLYDRMLVQHLQRQGDEVQMFALPARPYAACLLQNFDAQFRRRLQSARLDVLLQDELNHPSLVVLNTWLRRHVRYPLLAIVHHLRCEERWRPAAQRLYRAMEARYLSSVAGVICNSAATLRAVHRTAGQILPGIVAAPGGDRFAPAITLDAIAARSVQAGALRIIFLGNLIVRKGLHCLLAALAKLPRTGWHLDVVGSAHADGGYAQRVRQQASALDIAANIAWHGSLPDDQLSSLLAGSHVLAVPAAHEGFGIAYLEGMGFGVPALAARSGGAAEFITDGVDGWLVDAEDASQLADRLRQLAADRSQLCTAALAARRRFEQQPTWEQSMQRVRAHLLQLAA